MRDEVTKQFFLECQERIDSYVDSDLARSAMQFMAASTLPKYSYNFTSLGRPIIQYPQDMIAMQEIIWSVRPDLIIEMGIAHGGSLILSASSLALLDYADAVNSGRLLNPNASNRRVLGVDIDIRPHNRAAIDAHPMAHKIDMIEGSSIAPEIIALVHEHARSHECILVCLDSNHTHDHVLAELEAYAPLTSKDSYCVVFDTIIEDLPADFYPDRPWGIGDNPKTAVWEYLKTHSEFEIDKSIDKKSLISVAPDGFLKRVR